MKRLTACVLVLYPIVLLATAQAEKDHEQPELLLDIDLVDGSRVIGIPSIESVQVRTSYAKLNIALRNILTIKITEDRGNWAIDLRNGDMMKGAMAIEPINLKTSFGMVMICPHDIKEMRVSVPGSQLMEVPRAGLVLHYSFDKNDGAKVSDVSGRGHDGVVRGATWQEGGRRCGEYRFDGVNDCISVPPMDLPKDITVCFWIRTTDSNEGNWPFAVFLVDRDMFGPSRDWSVGLGQGGRIQFNTGSPGTDSQDNVLTCPKHVNDGTWVHVAVVRSTTDATKRIYVNGRLEASSNFDAEPFENTGLDIYIGASVCDTMQHRFFNGSMDDVMIYDRALSDDEVKSIYEAQK
jgi:hypothetical protein